MMNDKCFCHLNGYEVKDKKARQNISAINNNLNNVNEKVNAVNNRMNTFTNLPEGSTTGDAELADIRIGYNGKEYETAGEAVREQIRDINDKMGNVTVLSSAYFISGMIDVGTGVTNSDYWICMPSPIAVKVGDKIVIKPNGMLGNVFIESVDDFANVTTHLKNIVINNQDIEYISEFDGFLFARLKMSTGQEITPNDYKCEISVGNTYVEELEKRVSKVEEETESNKKTPLISSHKHKPFTKIIDDCQTIGDWRDSVTADTSNFIFGTQSLKSTSQMRCIKHKIDMVNNDLVLKIKINSIANNARLLLRVSHLDSPSLGVFYELARGSEWTTSNDWQEIAIPYTAYTYGNVEGFDFTNVDDLIFQASEGSVDWNLQFVGLRPKTQRKGIVTFTFDDGYKSQYTGIKILAERGITGTIFHIVEATESSENTDALSVAELQELVNYYGADIEVHGDPSYDQWSEEDLVNHWAGSQAWLKHYGLSDGKYMAYPNGKFPDNVVQLAKGYFDSCRTITPYIPIETLPTGDRYRVRAVTSAGNSDASVTAIRGYIDKTVACGGWLILVFHKIGNGGTDGDGMWCTEPRLMEIADYAIYSGAQIMNYAEAFETMNFYE